MTHASKFSRRHVGISWIVVSSLFLFGALLSLAQLPTGTILGAVKDSSGAVVPDVTLTARNVETGQTRTAVTAGDGSYRLSALPVGSYEVRAEHSGFRTEVRSGLTLAVTQEAVVNFALAVGGVEQTVEVTAEAPLINTTTGSLGGLVDEQRIADLPLNGRNYTDLILLQPGISQHSNTGKGGPGIGTQFSSNGAPIYSNNYLLDGASTANFLGATTASVGGSTLGVDGIREYRMVTNSFSAEYGMTMGSQMLIVTKSGTNTFHGSAFEFLRNSTLDARNFFDYQTALTPGRLPPFKRNNFGGSFGGPIKKDKTFFFGVYEGLRERLGITTILTVIPAAAKVDGGSVPQIAPVVKPFLPYFPDPNLPNNQYTYPFSQPNTESYGQARVDQTISSADTAFVRYTIDDGEIVNPVIYPQNQQPRISRNQYGTISENHIFSPSLLNTFRFSYSRTTRLQDTNSTGLIGPQYSFITGQEAGNINISGIGRWGPPSTTPQHQKQNIFTWSDDLFYTRGRHALKFGTLINRFRQYTLPGLVSRGTIAFASLNSFLLAQPSSFNGATPGSILDKTFHYTTMGFYFQDDLRVRSNLTLNLGLRYEFNTTYEDKQGVSANLRDILHDATTTLGPPFKNPSLRNISPRFGFAWDVRGDGKMAVRGGFGLLYDIGNLGALYHNGVCALPFCSSSAVSIPVTSPITLTLPLVFPPGTAGKAMKNLDYNLQQPHMLQYNLGVERQLPWDTAVTLAYAGSRGLNLLRYNEGNPTVPQILPDGRKFWIGTEPRVNPNWDTYELHDAAADSWYNSLQFGLIKRLSRGLQFQSSYTWSKLIDTNQGRNPGDSLTSIYFQTDPFDNRRERAVASFDITQNLRLNAIYRIPELISSGGVVGSLLNGWGISGIMSLQTGYPSTPVLTTNRSRSRVNAGAAPASQVVATDRPDLVPGRNNSNITHGTTAGCPGVAAGQKLGTPNLYLDPCAFTLQPAGFLGTSGRNILRGPGIVNVDFSLAKDTALHFLGETGKLEFRADFFNILNKANFATPSAGGSGANSATVIFAGRADGERPLATAGLITATSTTSRQIQLSLKIVF